jgi:hypothetical protein
MSVRNLIFKLKDGTSGFINLNRVQWMHVKDNTIQIFYNGSLYDNSQYLSYDQDNKALEDFNKIITSDQNCIQITPNKWY